ncbi:MAG: hypothetical protein K8T20_15825 [Planctomycetes bacterium]|nr:hypothetical protein [Planctomycetota bacterium]
MRILVLAAGLSLSCLLVACGKKEPTAAGNSNPAPEPAWRAVHGDRPSMPVPLAKMLHFGMPLEEVKASCPDALKYDFAPPWPDPKPSRVNVSFLAGEKRAVKFVLVQYAPGTARANLTATWGPGTDGSNASGPTVNWKNAADGIKAELSLQATADVLIIEKE